MSVGTISEVANNYFNTLNPIAERISNDIESIKEAYEDLWQCLSYKEKEEIINETVIYPEAVLKYALQAKDRDISEQTGTGLKYVVDEHTGSTWRDEHSAPFSWKTPSQINLHLFSTELPRDGGHLLPGNKRKLIHDKTGHIKCENSIQSQDKTDGWNKKVLEEHLAKKMYENPEPPNLVVGGTCSRISELCSRLKFLPGKTCSYEVKTVVAYTQNGATNDGNLLNKIKANTVLKIQNTIKYVGGKNFISSEKKHSLDVGETENLVDSKQVTIAKLSKPSPKVAKPKSPPPPPPVVKPPPSKEEKLIVVKTSKNEAKECLDMEKENLLSNEPQNDQPPATLCSDDELSMSGDSDAIPKSGFDFLDNW